MKMTDNKRIGLNPLDAMMQAPSQIKSTPQDSSVVDQQRDAAATPKRFQRYTFFLTVEMKKWLDKTIYEIKMDHDFGSANTSNLVSFVIAQAQKNGIDYDEYQAYVRTHRGRR